MTSRTLICAFCFGTLWFSSWAIPFPMDANGDDFWSKSDFVAAAARRDQKLEPVEDTMTMEEITAADGENYEDDAVGPHMLIKTNYEEEGNTSQILTPSQLSSSEKEHLALNFFSKFQYHNGNEQLVEKQQLIRKMQRNYGLPLTGELDDETVTMMTSPRCGNADVPQNYNYFPGRPQWRKTTVTYKITGYSPDLSPCNTRNIFRRAFHIWSTVVELDFVETTENADMQIYFAYGWHTDPWAFDGKNNVLAHAFPPGGYKLGGATHFDESELWTLGKGQIRDTYFGNSKGAPCVFPFTYKKKVYNACVTEEKRRKGRPWCATTTNYDADKKFGFCPSPRLFTYGGNGEGRRCKFPFNYKGREYTSCTKDGRQDEYKWCSITSDYDKNKKWGFCPSPIEPSQGNGYSLLIVATHEFGHAIGLQHSSSHGALMYRSYTYSDPLKLSDDDIEGARRLYGARKSKLPPLKLEKCGYKRFN